MNEVIPVIAKIEGGEVTALQEAVDGEDVIKSSYISLSSVQQHQSNINIHANQITSGTLSPDRISEISVTQYESALSINESQINDLGNYATVSLLDDHKNNTNNPHNVSLEQARQINNVISGRVVINAELNVESFQLQGVTQNFSNFDTAYNRSPTSLSLDGTILQLQREDSSTLEIDISGASEGVSSINQIGDVSIFGPEDAQLLCYQVSTGEWLNKDIDTVLSSVNANIDADWSFRTLKVSGPQDVADFRVRNFYADNTVPSDSMGEDGDCWIRFS